MTDKKNLKITIIGDGSCGKTSYLRLHEDHIFSRKYVMTIGCDVQKLIFETNYGSIEVECWDIAGQKTFESLREAYYQKSDGAIVMFDLSSRPTFKSVPDWIRKFKTICPQNPFILVGNKCDLKHTVRKSAIESYLKKLEYRKYIEMSCKEGINIDKPFLELIKLITGKSDLEIIKIDYLKEDEENNNEKKEETITWFEWFISKIF